MKTKNISNDSIEAMIPLLIQVQRDIDQNLDLESMAARFGYSPFHFHRLFKKAVDETPRQYVGRLRLESAAYKLLITDESILDIPPSGTSCTCNSRWRT